MEDKDFIALEHALPSTLLTMTVERSWPGIWPCPSQFLECVVALNTVISQPTMCCKARTAIIAVVFAAATAAVAALPWVVQHQLLLGEADPDGYDAEAQPTPSMVAVAAIAVVVFLCLECLILWTNVRAPLYCNALLVAAGAALAPPYFAYALQADRRNNAPHFLQLWLLLGVPTGLALGWAFVKIHA